MLSREEQQQYYCMLATLVVPPRVDTLYTVCFVPCGCVKRHLEISRENLLEKFLAALGVLVLAGRAFLRTSPQCYSTVLIVVAGRKDHAHEQGSADQAGRDVWL